MIKRLATALRSHEASLSPCLSGIPSRIADASILQSCSGASDCSQEKTSLSPADEVEDAAEQAGPGDLRSTRTLDGQQATRPGVREQMFRQWKTRREREREQRMSEVPLVHEQAEADSQDTEQAAKAANG